MNQGSRINQDISREDIEQIFKTNFGKDTVVQSFKRIKNGLFNTSYYVKTEYPSNIYVLRIAPIRQELLFSWEQNVMAVEQTIYKLLKENGIPTVNIVKYDESHEIIPGSYIITEYIDGIPLNDPSFPISYKNKIRYELGIYTAKIHKIKSNKFGWPKPDGSIFGSSKWPDVIKLFSDELTRKSSNNSIFDDKEIKEFDSFISKNLDIFDISETPSLVHFDLWAPNVLVKKIGEDWSIAAIIDADHAMFADREFEFVLWPNESFFMKGYGIPLNSSKEAVLKRKAYDLIFSFICACAYKIQHGNDTEYLNSKKRAVDILSDVNKCL
ncbi:MAG: aminoglycoside phosphotransferase family protein [Clostridiaceae bacterium]|nr:aminoglycoside phosphotransferase family protein [Clostridiaceae bacterium]